MKKDKSIELGKFLQDVAKGKVNKATGQNEGTDAQGGYLVERALIPQILAPNFAEGKLYADTTIFNVGDFSNGAKIPINAGTERSATAGIKGGAIAYWVNEAATKTASTVEFDQLDLQLNKIAVVVYITDELLQDAQMLANYVSRAASEAIMYKIDRAIVYGNAGQLNGIMGSTGTSFVNTSDPITAAEIKDMFDAYYGGPNGKWYMGQVTLQEVMELYGDNGHALVFENGKWYLWGYPIQVSDVFESGHLFLGDLSQYVVVQKELTQDVSMHLKYLEDESCYRFVLRINGANTWKSGITLEDGQEVFPFVATAQGEMSSSSESSSSSSSSSLSSDSSSSLSSDSSLSSSSSYDSSSSSSSSSSSGLPPNLIVNGDFQTGNLDGWSNIGDLEWEVNGSNQAYIEAVDSEYAELEQTSSDGLILSNNTDYIFMINIISVPAGGSVGVKLKNGDYTYFTTTGEKEVTITSGDDAGVDGINLETNGVDGSYIIDDLYLYEA